MTVESAKKPPGEGERAVTGMTAYVSLHLKLTIHLTASVPTFKLDPTFTTAAYTAAYTTFKLGPLPPFLTFKRPPN